MNVEFAREDEIDRSIRSEIVRLLRECFADQPGYEAQLASRPDPTWRLYGRDHNQKIIAHLAVHERQVGTSSGDISVALVGDVAVAPPARGQGLARELLARAHEIIRSSNILFSILFAHIPEIYISSGYSLMESPIRFWDTHIEEPAWRTLVYRGSMICQLGDQELPPGVIDLRGPTV